MENWYVNYGQINLKLTGALDMWSAHQHTNINENDAQNLMNILRTYG